MGKLLSEINCNVCLINSIWLYSPLFSPSLSFSLILRRAVRLVGVFIALSPAPKCQLSCPTGRDWPTRKLGVAICSFVCLVSLSSSLSVCLLSLVVCFHFAIAQPADSSVAKSGGSVRARVELSQSKRPAVAAERFIEHSVVVVAVAARTGFCLNL